MESSWSDCLELYDGWQKGEVGIRNRIQNAVRVNFRDFPHSFNSITPSEQKAQVQAVNTVLKIRQHLEKVGLWWCNLNDDHLKILLEVFANVKMEELDVSSNNIGPSGMIHLAKLAEQCEVKKLTTRWCDLESEHLKNFVENAGNAKINELNVSDNKISPSGMIHLAKLAEQCEVKRLTAECCYLESEHLMNFIENSGKTKLTELDISMNDNIGPEGWLHIGQFIKQSGLRKLTAWDCSPSEQCLEEFIRGMNGAKVDYLKLDLTNEYEDNEDEEGQPSNILSLLPLVNETLDLSEGYISHDQRKEIQEKLNQDRLMFLTVIISFCRLRASPMDLPSTLDSVENVKANRDGDSILVKWNPLDADDVSYHVHVESECKTVVYDITTADTSYRMLSLRSKTEYYFYVWGFTSTAISEYTSCDWHKTGIIRTSQPESVIASVYDARNIEDSRKRSNSAMNTSVGNEESCKPKKARVLESWLETGLHVISSTPPADNDQDNVNMTVPENGHQNQSSLNSAPINFRIRNTEAAGTINVGMRSNGAQVMPQRTAFTRLQEDLPDLLSLSPPDLNSAPDDQSESNMPDQRRNGVHVLMNAGLNSAAYPDSEDIWNMNDEGDFSGAAGWIQASLHTGQQFREPSNHDYGVASKRMMNGHPANGNAPTASFLDTHSATLPATAAQRLQHVDTSSDSQSNDQFTAHRDSQTPEWDILAAAMPVSLNEFPMDSSAASTPVHAPLRTVHTSTSHLENVPSRSAYAGNHMANHIPSQRSHSGHQRPVNLSMNHTGSIPPLNAHAVNAVLQACYAGNLRQGSSSADHTGRLLQTNAGNPAVGNIPSQISHSADQRQVNSSGIHAPPNVQAANPTANANSSQIHSANLRAADSPTNYMGNVRPSDIQAVNPGACSFPSQMRYSADQRQVNTSINPDARIPPPNAHGRNSVTNAISSQINYSANQRSSDPPICESNLANICREVKSLQERVAKQDDKIARQEDKIAKHEEKITKQQKEIVKLGDEKKKLKKALDSKISRNKKSQSNEIAKIKEDNQTQVEEIANLKNRVEKMTRSDQGSNLDQMQEFTLPMTNVDKVNENDALLADREKAKHLISYLGTVGGSKSKDIVHRIMRKLFTTNVAKAYSWEGKKGKLSFCHLNIANVIREACKKYQITEAKADRYAMLWLRGAPDRDGGRKKRELQKQEKASHSTDSEAQKEKASHSADTEEPTS